MAPDTFFSCCPRIFTLHIIDVWVRVYWCQCITGAQTEHRALMVFKSFLFISTNGTFNPPFKCNCTSRIIYIHCVDNQCLISFAWHAVSLSPFAISVSPNAVIRTYEISATGTYTTHNSTFIRYLYISHPQNWEHRKSFVCRLVIFFSLLIWYCCCCCSCCYWWQWLFSVP